VASNHLSFTDSFVISPLIRRRVVYLTKSYYFELPGRAGRFIRWGLTMLGNVPIRCGPQRAALRALEEAAGVLAAGGVVAIYPEGTRSTDGLLYRGRTGVGWLALNSGVPVLPVGLEGTDRILPTGGRFPRLHVRPTIRIGEPMDFSRYRDLHPAAARRVITDEIMETIRKLSGQEYTGRYNPRADA
jgi:1-acyl-sn-glycerol-3-phosphate acyltransferase